MRFIKELDKPEEGGECANCGGSFNAMFMRKLLMEFMTEDKYGEYYAVQEPFSFCNSCALKMQNK